MGRSAATRILITTVVAIAFIIGGVGVYARQDPGGTTTGSFYVPKHNSSPRKELLRRDTAPYWWYAAAGFLCVGLLAVAAYDASQRAKH